MGLIFRSALPEELEWENRAEDVALSLDAINRCLLNMLTALDRGFPLLTDEYRRPMHPEIEEYMRRYISKDQGLNKSMTKTVGV